MPTTQSKDPNERVDHPRHYNQHASGIECIELIEHLPSNTANAVKYIWRCGLKMSETPLRDLQSARWYTEREERRLALYGTDVVVESRVIGAIWRATAKQIIASEDKNPDIAKIVLRGRTGIPLADYLASLLTSNFSGMLEAVDAAITVEMKASALAFSESLRHAGDDTFGTSDK